MTANHLTKRLRDRYAGYTAVPLETLLLQAAEAIEDLTRQVTELRKAQGEPVARLLHWKGPTHIPVPHGGIVARTYAEFSKDTADEDRYWFEGAPLYTAAAPTAPTAPEPTFREPDLHTPGIYVVLDADGAPVLETVDTTGYSARATFVREKNLLWSKAQEQGYHIVELRPV